MIKAKDFWECLCDELEFRFFTGVACEGFKSVYDTMDSNVMHYIPAISEEIALGIATGVALTGNKSCVLIAKDRKYLIDKWLDFNRNMEIPVLIILRDTDETVPDTHNFLTVLRRANNNINKNSKPVIVYLKEGALK